LRNTARQGNFESWKGRRSSREKKKGRVNREREVLEGKEGVPSWKRAWVPLKGRTVRMKKEIKGNLMLEKNPKVRFEAGAPL